MSGGAYRRDPSAFRGAVETRPFESALLAGNPLGDPHVREVPVYLPPAALDGERLPVIFLLAGFTGRGQSMLETHPWRAGAVRAYDRRLAQSGDRGAILVMPDCFTRYGGSQYVDSGATGPYASHVAEELVAFVDILTHCHIQSSVWIGRKDTVGVAAVVEHGSQREDPSLSGREHRVGIGTIYPDQLF